MLSFDITDRNIRIIRGNESGGKIKIQSSASIEIPEGTIINGYIRDIPQLATTINQTLKNNKMGDKDAVVSISSNLVVFKELHIPRAKPVEFKTMVQNQMQQTISVTEAHCISYTIAGTVQGEGNDSLKVLATACPRDVVDCYKKVFSMLGISLKTVAVSCNCISRIVLADTTIKNKMPLLLVQIDPNFINLNLYENGQLAFSRFASISPDDYDDKSDYVFQAVNENIYRMFQFQRTRSSDAIQNVVFYGDTSEFIRLTNALEQMDIKSSLLKIPSQLSGYENLEFSTYANAIGAMFKSQKDIESINLLDVDTGTTNQVQVSGSSLGLQIAGVFGGGAVLVGLITLSMVLINNGIQKDISEIDGYIKSEKIATQLAKIDSDNAKIEKLNKYKEQVTLAKNCFDSNPILRKSVFDYVDSCLSGAAITKIKYDKGSLDLTGTAKDPSIPSTFVEKLVTAENDIGSAFGYPGYKMASAALDASSTNAIPINNGDYEFEASISLTGEAVLTGTVPKEEAKGSVGATSDTTATTTAATTKTESGDAQ